MAFGSFSFAFRREVLESGREHRHCARDGFEEILRLALKGDCANRRLAALLMPYSGLDVVKSLGSENFSNLVPNAEVAASLPFSAVKSSESENDFLSSIPNPPSPTTNAHLLSTQPFHRLGDSTFR